MASCSKTKEKEMRDFGRIIEKIEKQRIKKISHFSQFSLGMCVEAALGKYQSNKGKIVLISPKKTSVIVEFANGKKARYFMNMKKNQEHINNLKITKKSNG